MKIDFGETYQVETKLANDNQEFEILMSIQSSNIESMLLCAQAKFLEVVFPGIFLNYISDCVQNRKGVLTTQRYSNYWKITIENYNFSRLQEIKQKLELGQSSTVKKLISQKKFSLALAEIFKNNNQCLEIRKKLIENTESEYEAGLIFHIEFRWENETMCEFLFRGQNENDSTELGALYILMLVFSSLVSEVPKI